MTMGLATMEVRPIHVGYAAIWVHAQATALVVVWICSPAAVMVWGDVDSSYNHGVY